MKFVVAEVTKGSSTLNCSAEQFGGVDPLDGDKKEGKDAEKACFCDNKKRLLSTDTISRLKDYWEQKKAVATATTSITSTTKVLEEVKTEIKTKTDEWKETLDVQETERKVAAEALEAQKKCVLAAKESAKRYKLESIRKKYQERKRALEL